MFEYNNELNEDDIIEWILINSLPDYFEFSIPYI